MKQSRLKQNKGALSRNLIVLFAMLCMVYFGYRLAHLEESQEAKQITSMQQTLNLLREENADLREALNKRQIALSLAELTAQEKINQQQHAQAALQEAQRQLGFYQNVMAPEVTQDGFLVDGVQVIPSASSGVFRLRFVLLQQRENKSLIKGALNIQIKGSQNGSSATLSAGAEQFFPEGKVAYRFKFFQSVEQAFTLSEDFVPEQLIFETDVYQYTTKRGEYRLVLEWQNVLESAISQ